MYYHQFSFEFLCLQGLGNTEVLFSLTKQHPFVSLCCRERWFPCLYLKKEEKLLTKTVNRFITLLKSFRSYLLFRRPPTEKRKCFEGLRGGWFLQVICWWDFASLRIAGWGGWFKGNGNNVSSMLVSCSIFSVTRLYSPVLCSSFCFPLLPRGKQMCIIMMFCAWQARTKISAVAACTSG